MADVTVQFRGVDKFQRRMKSWIRSQREKTQENLRKIGRAWVTEAKRRVPVNTGRLRNSIDKETGIDATGDFFVAVGSSVRYAPFLEFGTESIAGGRVKALGTGPIITDEQAVKDWPAKRKRGARRQQMPFLRPAFSFLRPKIIELLNETLEIPK